jgi:hypothetical protein
MEDPHSLRLSELSLPNFGRLFHILYYGYLGHMFGPVVAKRHLCYNVLCYVEDQDDLVVSQELLRPDYSYPGLPRTFSVSHDLYSYLRCNSVAADNSRRIILDCEVAQSMRVVPQNLFAPYAGLPRSQSELQNASLVPPIFFILRDHSVGLRLDTARSAESRSPLLLYNDWCPLEGKASIKMRIEVRVDPLGRSKLLLIVPTCCSGTAISHGRHRFSYETAKGSLSRSHGWCNWLLAELIVSCG